MAKKEIGPRATSDIDKFVGGRIRMGRISVNMSQEELGTALGVSFQQIQKYERGVNRISAGRLSLIADALGQSVQWFLDEPETAAAKTQDAVMTQLLSTSRGRELAANYLVVNELAQAQILSLSRTFMQMAV